MSRYHDLVKDDLTRGLLTQLTPVPRMKCDELRMKYPDLPSDYLDFLSEVGYGVIGRRQYMLYDGVLPLSELLADACDPHSADLLVFGDTLGGTSHGFDPSERMGVIAVDLDTQEVERMDTAFERFIRALLKSFIEESHVQTE